MPEQENTQEQLNDSGEQQQTQETQQTLPQKDPRIDNIEAGLSEMRSMMGRLVNQATQQVTKEEAPAALTQDEFFKNPQALLDRFNDSLAKTVAPLLEFKNSVEGQNRVEGIKAKIKRDPKLAKALEIVGDDLDSAIATMSPEHINEGAIGGLLLTLYGNKVLNAGEGGIVTTKTAAPILPSNAQATNMSEVPAHLRPSGSKAAPAPTPAKTSLTPEEESVMSRFGYDKNNEEHRKEFKSAFDEGEVRGNRVQIVGKEVGGR